MKRFAPFLLLGFLFPSLNAVAQYSGSGVNTCLAYAQKDVRQHGSTPAKIVFDRDQHLTIEKFTRKVGSQFVASLLFGNGAIVYQEGVAIEMSFVCLLASDKRAVFFFWSPRFDAHALERCRRGSDATACLDALLRISEQDLTQLYAQHYVGARTADAKAGNENALTAFRRSGDAWKAYRDAECARRGGGAQAAKACVVDLTRRRSLDLR